MLTLADEARAWELWQVEQRGYDRRNTRISAGYVMKWIEHSGGSLTPGSCMEWVRDMTRDRKLTPHTIRNRMSACRQFAGWMVVQGRLDSNPWLHVQAPRGRTGAGADSLTPEEIQRLIGAADQVAMTADKRVSKSAAARSVLYRLLATTGMRWGEWRAQAWEDIDLNRATLTLTKDKSRRHDKLPLSGETVETLLAWREIAEPSRLVFAKMPTIKGLNKDMKAAGISGRGKYHRFRTGFITNAFKLRVPAELIQRLARHRYIDQTFKYFRHSEPDLVEATEKISAIGKKISHKPLDTEKSDCSTARMLKPVLQDEQRTTPHAGRGFQQNSALRAGFSAVRSGAHGREDGFSHTVQETAPEIRGGARSRASGI